MKKLLTVGCSHTEGSECTTSWPTEFSKLTGIDVINLGNGGASNYSILNDTVKYLETHKVDAVIIAWTTLERFQFSFNGRAVDYSFHKRSEGTPGRRDETQLNNFFRFADLNMADWNYGKGVTETYVLLLQNYLENNNIPYIFFNMFNSAFVNDQNYKFNSINFDKYYIPTEGILEKYLDEYPEAFTETKHAWDPKIHKMIAEEILNSKQWYNMRNNNG